VVSKPCWQFWNVGGMEAIMRISAHDNIEQLRHKLRLKDYLPIQDRIRAVIGAREGKTASQIGRELGYTLRWAQKWVGRYNQKGLEGLYDLPRSGQPTKLKSEGQQALMQRIEAGATATDKVCALRGRDFQQILRQEFGADYSLGGVYGLLHRLGYCCLRPRPRHRKNNPEAMNSWKAEAPFLSNKSGGDIRISRSIYGARMKAVLDNKAH
jgi:transposase